MTQAELSKELYKILTAAQKQAKTNGDAYVGTDTLLRALSDNKDIASALTEAGGALSTTLSLEEGHPTPLAPKTSLV